ncbi:hypothetical protein [Kitasatospora sp. NPDC047058]|uniref:hypothetical protein n=1 Tax=Kitasatospora sp. NPDC047058 TaxID=3155620 RepID=UPI0033ED76E3
MTEKPDTPATGAEDAPKRLATTATRTLGALTASAVAVCVALAVRRPWSPSGDPLLTRAAAAALALAALRVVAGFLAPRAAPATPTDPGTPRPALGELRAATTRIRRRAWRRALGTGAFTLLAVAAVPALDAPFTGAPPEAAERRIALDEAGARWDEFEVLPPIVNGDSLPAYPRYALYRLRRVDGTLGERIDLSNAGALEDLPAGTRLRVLHVPGTGAPAPLADREIEPFLEPAPLHRTAGLIWASVALAAALVALAAERGSSAAPTRARSEAFLTGPLHWARVAVPGTTIEVTLPTPEPEPGAEDDDPTPETEHRMVLEQPPDADRRAGTAPAPDMLRCPALQADRRHLTPATGWLVRDPAGTRALLALDHGTTVWASVPAPATPPAGAVPVDAVSVDGSPDNGGHHGGDPAPAPRVLTPPPATRQPWGALILLAAAGWPAGWLLHHLLAAPGRSSPPGTSSSSWSSSPSSWGSWRSSR